MADWPERAKEPPDEGATRPDPVLEPLELLQEPVGEDRVWEPLPPLQPEAGGVAAGFDELQPEDDGEAGFVEEKPLPPEEERVDEDHDEDLPLRENEELERLARAGAARATTSTRARQTEKTRQGPRCMTGPPS